jgi:hypothetical protein
MTTSTLNKLMRKQLAHKHSCNDNGWTEFVQFVQTKRPAPTDSSYRMKKQEEKLKLESKGGWK